MHKKLMLSFLMAGLISTTYTPAVHADWIDRKNILIVLSIVLIPSVWQYITKKEVLKRYDLEELKAGKNILKNLYYLYLDGFWGTPPKSESIKLKDADGNEVVFEIKGPKVDVATVEKTAKRDGTGIIGTIHTNNKNILTTSAWVAALWALLYSDKIYAEKIDWAKLYDLFKDPANAVKLNS